MKTLVDNILVRGPRKNILLLPAIFLSIALLACQSNSQPAANAAPLPSTTTASPATAEAAVQTIEIKGFKYLPDTLTVHPGDKVQWKNNDIVPHTATTESKGFDTGNILNGQAKTITVPDKKGVYPYICTLHPNMKAKLIVE
jgi:plastocyanin